MENKNPILDKNLYNQEKNYRYTKKLNFAFPENLHIKKHESRM